MVRRASLRLSANTQHRGLALSRYGRSKAARDKDSHENSPKRAVGQTLPRRLQKFSKINHLLVCFGFFLSRNRAWYSSSIFILANGQFTQNTTPLRDPPILLESLSNIFRQDKRSWLHQSFNTVTISVQVPLKWSSSLQYLRICLIHSCSCSELVLILRQKNLQYFSLKF